jgi:hypothetical protein
VRQDSEASDDNRSTEEMEEERYAIEGREIYL